jgi:hypothetical protein
VAKNDYDFPSNNALVTDDQNITMSWLQWVQRTHTIASSLQQSGPTSERPTSLLWIGRRYFDTDLGYPIWLRSIEPNVWINAEGRVAGTPLSTNGPLFRAVPSAAGQVLNINSTTLIQLQSEVYDTNNNFVNSTFTPTVPGYYQINWFLDMSYTVNTLQFVYSLMSKNGGFTSFGNLIGGNTTAGNNRFASVGADIVSLNGAGDNITLYGFINAAAPRVEQAYLSGHFIRPL